MDNLKEFLSMIGEAIRILESPHDEEAGTVKAAADLVTTMSALADLVITDDH